MQHALILCSGGLDSVTTAYYVKNTNPNTPITLLFFNYGQRAMHAERRASRAAARALEAKFVEMKLSALPQISSSPLTKKTASLPQATNTLKNTRSESAAWYVPARNVIFLSYALSWAEAHYLKTHAHSTIFVGFKNEGKEPYPDATSDFLKKINALATAATKSKPSIHAPLISKDKEDIVLLAHKLKVPLQKTFSCYTSSTQHCGACLACRLRKSGFYWANLPDPTSYQS